VGLDPDQDMLNEAALLAAEQGTDEIDAPSRLAFGQVFDSTAEQRTAYLEAA
jgi:hypothetical protein